MSWIFRSASFSPGEKAGCLALGLGFVLLLVHPPLAIVVLLAFLLLCLGAPFFPASSFFLPVISRGRPGAKGVVLTFDDGPSPDSTPLLLERLSRYNLQATFFVVGEQAKKYPHLIADILNHGHTIGNHSLRHDPLLMFRSTKKLKADIQTTQNILRNSGINPRTFRPPAGITNPRLGKVLTGEGLVAVTYSCRAMDCGNRYIENLAEKILHRLRSGDIIMLHDLPPQRKNQRDIWLQELDFLFKALKERYSVVSLEDISRITVMRVEE